MQQTRSFSNPSQYSWNAALRDIQSAQRMDEVFSKVQVAIEQHAALLKRDAAVRLKLWLSKLSEQTNNPVWKKNRNAYAKLLLNQLKQGCLEKPFNAGPPSGPLQTLPASLTYAFSLPRTSSSRTSLRAASSVASSQGSPNNNAGEAPQLEDYQGRHASPQRMTSGGSVITVGQDHAIPQGPEHDSPQLTYQKSGLWGVESNPSRQPSVGAGASSPPQRRQSQSSQRSGALSTDSNGSSKVEYRAESNADSRAEVGQRHKSPVRAPSRLRDSTTGEAEARYAPAASSARQSLLHSSAEEEEDNLQQKPYKQKHRVSVSGTSAAEKEDDRQQSLRHRRSPRVLQGSRQKPMGTTAQPHQHYHSPEEYFSRARVREALSPGKGPSHNPRYPAKARVLDLHDECMLADEQEDDLSGRADPRDSGQGCAQVQLGGTSMRVSRGLQRGRRGDGVDLSDESWQPSKLELQARLGASKERQLELEWRLQQAEEKIAQAQAQQVAQQLAASQKPVTEQPTRQRVDSKKDKLKKDLGKLIHKYEKRQYRWGSPRKAASMDHLLPLPSRSGSSENSIDDMAEIAAVLRGCTPYSPADISTGDHPLSQGFQEPRLQGMASKPRHSSSSASLSGGSSCGASDTDAQLRRHDVHVQPAASFCMGAADLEPPDEAGRFVRKLQEFQKGTDMLRRQISMS